MFLNDPACRWLARQRRARERCGRQRCALDGNETPGNDVFFSVSGGGTTLAFAACPVEPLPVDFDETA